MRIEKVPTTMNDISAKDAGRGLLRENGMLWRMSEATQKQRRVTDEDFMHALSRKQLEAFIEKLKDFKRKGPAILFRAEAAFSVGDTHERERFTVRVELSHNMGLVALCNARKASLNGYPTSFTTRTETIRENKGALLIMGTARNEDFAIWISPSEDEA